jgi:GntR family transcriptional regulator
MTDETTPPYRQIAKRIRDQIVAGVEGFRVGDKLPSTRELVEQEGVAKATVDKTMRALREDDLVVTRPGVGLVVKDHRRGDTPKDMFLRSTGLQQGIRLPSEQSEYLHCGYQDLPHEVADAMGLPRMSKAVCRSRLIKRSGSPVNVATSWFPYEFGERAPRLLQRKPIKGGTPRYLADVLGKHLSEGVDIVEAQEAGRQVGEWLHVHPGEPVMFIASRITDSEGGLIEYGVYHYRQETQASYRYELDYVPSAET